MSKTLTAKQQYWSDQLQRAEDFDGNFADYARSQGLPVNTLYRWRHCLKQRENKAQQTKTVFTQVISPSMRAENSLTLEFGDIHLRFSGLPEPHWLAQFLALSHSS